MGTTWPQQRYYNFIAQQQRRKQKQQRNPKLFLLLLLTSLSKRDKSKRTNDYRYPADRNKPNNNNSNIKSLITTVRKPKAVLSTTGSNLQTSQRHCCRRRRRRRPRPRPPHHCRCCHCCRRRRHCPTRVAIWTLSKHKDTRQLSKLGRESCHLSSPIRHIKGRHRHQRRQQRQEQQQQQQLEQQQQESIVSRQKHRLNKHYGRRYPNAQQPMRGRISRRFSNKNNNDRNGSTHDGRFWRKLQLMPRHYNGRSDNSSSSSNNNGAKIKRKRFANCRQISITITNNKNNNNNNNKALGSRQYMVQLMRPHATTTTRCWSTASRSQRQQSKQLLQQQLQKQQQQQQQEQRIKKVLRIMLQQWPNAPTAMPQPAAAPIHCHVAAATASCLQGLSIRCMPKAKVLLRQQQHASANATTAAVLRMLVLRRPIAPGLRLRLSGSNTLTQYNHVYLPIMLQQQARQPQQTQLQNNYNNNKIIHIMLPQHYHKDSAILPIQQQCRNNETSSTLQHTGVTISTATIATPTPTPITTTITPHTTTPIAWKQTVDSVNCWRRSLQSYLLLATRFWCCVKWVANLLALSWTCRNFHASFFRLSSSLTCCHYSVQVCYFHQITFVSRIGGPQNGTFSAPLLHNHKNHSRQCLYTFLAGPGQRVEVLFTSFNLRGSPPDGSAVGELPTCVHEYMDIYSEVQSSDPAELINSPFGGRYCGTIPPRRRISMYRAVAISFFTNKNVSMPDLFEGTYKFINASEYEIGIPIAGSPCSYTITPSMSINKTGALISPTYPGAYPKDMSCTYQFLGEKNQRVRLEFRDFDLFFGGPHCPFDYVKVYDGPDNSSALIGTYCGQQRNLVLYSSESSLFVHFYTLPRTANTQNRGFKGIYEFSESFVKLDFIRENDGIHIRGSECDQKILSKKESTGFVLSPNYPYPYIPKTVCRYFIYGMQDAQHLERVRLEFSAFNIPKVEHKDKSESNCTDGYLKIYLKGQETADAYDKFDYELCGNETQRVISDGPRLAMVFSSGELQGRGFKGKYTFETEYKIPGTAAPDGTCSFTYVSSSKKRGELNSPRYPSNYPSETNCSYLFLGEPNEQVTIVFDHFKVKAEGNANATVGAYGSNACFEDWLEMYVVYRDNNDRLLGRYCDLTAPGPVESPRGAVGLRITLHTDQEKVASGFKARYFFETAKSDVGDCGGNFSNEDSGIITSPNYPAGYKAPGRGMASMACNWIMTARPGYKLSINFEQFSIEGDPATRGCPAAVLRLWVNVDSDQPPLELCGEKPAIEQWHYISTGQTARISFTTSDKTVGAQGFRIVWTEIQDSGPGPPSIGLLCESTYHFQCEVGYCISDKLRCDGVKNCGPGDNSDEMHCITEAPEEDHGVLIIIALVVSFLICLLCTLCHSRRKRRNHVRQLGLHRNAHYDSQTSATVGLSSSRRHLQAGGSLHGINSGNLILPPAPLPPTSVPSYYVSGDDDDDLDDDDDDMQREIFINDVRFDESTENHVIHLDV